MAIVLSRRSLLVGLALATEPFSLTVSWAREASKQPVQFDVRIAFEPDGTLIVTTGKSEMGQGVLSGFAQIVADEVGADWARTKAISGPAHAELRPPGIGEQITGGSMSIRLHYRSLRLVGAAVREMLLAEAADQWGVPAAELRARDHRVEHVATGRRLDFSLLVRGAARRAVPADPALRPTAELMLTGRPLARRDIPEKLDGRARYGVDIRLPGMVFASVRHAPVTGSRVVAIDKTLLAGLRGIVDVVDLGDAVAVVADTWWRAEKGADALRVTFSSTEHDDVSTQGIFALLSGALGGHAQPVAQIVGNPDQAYRSHPRSVTEDFTAPLLAHATMEPMSCAAVVTDRTCEVFAPTQGQDAARRAAAIAAGLPETAVTIHTTLMGGSFGRRYEWDFVTQAVTIARKVGRPVLLIWPREQDIRHDFFRPPAAARLTAALDDKGRIALFEATLAAPSANLHAWPGSVVDGVDRGALDGLIDNPYDIPHQRLRFALTPVHLNVGFWRSVAYSINLPFLEGFMDRLAVEAELDPVAFRLRHLSHDPRAARVLSRCAELANRATREGAVVGIAFGRPFMTPTAVAVEAERRNGEVVVRRSFAVVDCGLVLNPRIVEAQASGGVLFGLAAARERGIQVQNGAVVASNLHDLSLASLGQSPEITVQIMPSSEPPTGIGEPTTPVAMAAFNAAIRRLGHA